MSTSLLYHAFGTMGYHCARTEYKSGQVTGVRIPVGFNPCYCITWDAENDLFWVSNISSDIYGIDREGNRIYTIDNDRRFRMSGLAWFEDDPDGYKLYTINNLRDEDGNSLVSVIKVDHETGEVVNVADLPTVEGERSGGCSFCNEIYDFTWAFLVQMQAIEDWLRIYEASSDFFWLNVEPLESFLFPGEEMDIHIGISTDGLIAEGTYTSHLLINHNTPVEGALWIDITLNVLEGEHSAPSDADVPFAYGLTSIYPNPFNAVGSVNFALDRASTVKLTVHDLVGRQVAVLTDGYISSGEYNVAIDGSSWSSGTYLVSLSDGSRVSLMKVVLLK